MKSKKAFTLIELLIVIVIIGILASVVLVSLNKAKMKAREADFITFISQISDLVEGSIVVGAFDQIPVGTVGCLGKYSAGESCWSTYSQNALVDAALEKVGEIPAARFSPHYNNNNRLAFVSKADAGTGIYVFIYVYYGDSAGKSMCDKFGWPKLNYGQSFCIGRYPL